MSDLVQHLEAAGRNIRERCYEIVADSLPWAQVPKVIEQAETLRGLVGANARLLDFITGHPAPKGAVPDWAGIVRAAEMIAAYQDRGELPSVTSADPSSADGPAA